jgi:hypothetical protein
MLSLQTIVMTSYGNVNSFSTKKQKNSRTKQMGMNPRVLISNPETSTLPTITASNPCSALTIL